MYTFTSHNLYYKCIVCIGNVYKNEDLVGEKCLLKAHFVSRSSKSLKLISLQFCDK